MNSFWPWLVLIAMGAFHGLNPGMGWLFAVARGLQERSRAAVLRSFAPIAFGHMASVALVTAIVAVAQSLVDAVALQFACALALLLFGSYKLIVRRHPRWVGMRVQARELVAWSFLMATAHGAGLMLVPVILHLPSDPMHTSHLAPTGFTLALPATTIHGSHNAHSDGAHAEFSSSKWSMETLAAVTGTGLAVVAVHTVALFVVMAGVAVVVYDRLGLALLRRAWFNLDLVWAWSLIGVGLLSLPWP